MIETLSKTPSLDKENIGWKISIEELFNWKKSSLFSSKSMRLFLDNSIWGGEVQFYHQLLILSEYLHSIV